MKAAGCAAWHDIDELAVMGLTEVITHLPRLHAAARAICSDGSSSGGPTCSSASTTRNSTWGSREQLKRAGLRYRAVREPAGVGLAPGRACAPSASRWTWCCACSRSNRISIASTACARRFVGHPLADQIPLRVDRAAARAELGIDAGARVLAVLPGSRRGEVEKLAGCYSPARPSCWPRVSRAWSASRPW